MDIAEDEHAAAREHGDGPDRVAELLKAAERVGERWPRRACDPCPAFWALACHCCAWSPASPGSSWARHRDQGQPEVADLGQQPAQCGLVREQANDDRLGAVAAELAGRRTSPPHWLVEDAVDAVSRSGRATSSRSRLFALAGSHLGGQGGVTGEHLPGAAGPVLKRPSLRIATAIPPGGARLVHPHATNPLREWPSPEGAHAGGIFRRGGGHDGAARGRAMPWPARAGTPSVSGAFCGGATQGRPRGGLQVGG